MTKILIICLVIITEGFVDIIIAGNKINDTIQVRKLLTQSNKYLDTYPIKADSFATAALGISKKINYSYGIAESYYCLAFTDKVRNHNAEAISYFYKSLRYTHRDSIEKIHKICLYMGVCLAFESDFDSSMVYLNKSLNMAKRIGKKKLITESLIGFARHYQTIGEYQKALNYGKEAYNTCDSAATPELFWRIKNYMGYNYLSLGQYKEAMELFYETLPEISVSNYSNIEIYKLYTYTATLHNNLKDYSKSLYYHSAALKESSKIQNKELADYYFGYTNYLVGTIYINLNMLDSAYYRLRQAESSKELMKDLQAKELIFYQIGVVFYSQQQYDSSFFYYQKGKEVSRIAKDTIGIKSASLGIGKTYFALKQFNKAKFHLEDALNSKLISDEIILDASKYLTEIYKQQGNFERALHYFMLYKETSDKKFNEENIKRITQLELQYIFNDKQKKAEFAQQQERLILETRIRNNRTTIYLIAVGFLMAILFSIGIFREYRNKRRANHEKEILIKEIHHRVKNNLQVISSMLSLQSNYLVDQKIKDAVAESQGRVKAMALIHQMLYQHEDFSAIEIDVYLEQLCAVISSTYSTNARIKLHTEIEKLKIDIDTAVPLGLVVNELLTNAYKYAFVGREDGIVWVQISRKTSDKYYLCIRDNGIGISQAVVDNPSTKSLGLNLVKILTRQLKGNLEIKNEGGTSFEILFTEIIKTNRKTA